MLDKMGEVFSKVQQSWQEGKEKNQLTKIGRFAAMFGDEKAESLGDPITTQVLMQRLREIKATFRDSDSPYEYMYEVLLDGIESEALTHVYSSFRELEGHAFARFINPVDYFFRTLGNPENRLQQRTLVEEMKRYEEENPGENKIVLDIGCGSSAFMANLFKENPNLKHYIGCDYSQELMDVGKEYVLPHFPDGTTQDTFPYSFEDIAKYGLEGMPEDIRKMIEENGGVDYITGVLTESFATNEEYEGMIKNLSSILKPGGKIILVTQDSSMGKLGGFSKVEKTSKPAWAVTLPLPRFDGIEEREIEELLYDLDSVYQVTDYHYIPVLAKARHDKHFTEIGGNYGLTTKIEKIRIDDKYKETVAYDTSSFAKVIKRISILTGYIPYQLVVYSKDKEV